LEIPNPILDVDVDIEEVLLPELWKTPAIELKYAPIDRTWVLVDRFPPKPTLIVRNGEGEQRGNPVEIRIVERVDRDLLIPRYLDEEVDERIPNHRRIVERKVGNFLL